MLHSKIMGRAHREDNRPRQKFFGGEVVKTKEGDILLVNYSTWATNWGCPRWDVYVTSGAPFCNTDLYDNGSIFNQDCLELIK